MRNGEGFSTATRDRVLAAATELGWVPNGPARGLASRRAGIVGLVFPDLGGSGEAEEESPLFVDEVIRGAERAATAAGDAVLIVSAHQASGRELTYSVAGKVDGLVVMARSLADRDIAALAKAVPIVVLAHHSSRHGLDFVSADNRGGSMDVTTHLLTVHGYSDLAFVGGPPRSPDSQERFAGFRAALSAAGLDAPAAPDAQGHFTEAGGHRATEHLLASGRRPRAIVYGNDEMAIGGLAALRAARIRVPTEVAVTGFDDIASCRHVRPALTTVRQPMRRLGEQAVELLFARIADPRADRRSATLPTALVLRGSCGCRGRGARSRGGAS
jgi:LacI family transcriptional regulator